MLNSISFFVISCEICLEFLSKNGFYTSFNCYFLEEFWKCDLYLEKCVLAIDRSQRAWLTGHLTNHNAESAILPEKQIRQDSRLTVEILTWKILCIDVFLRLK